MLPDLEESKQNQKQASKSERKEQRCKSERKPNHCGAPTTLQQGGVTLKASAPPPPDLHFGRKGLDLEGRKGSAGESFSREKGECLF